jgi:hypothetical protein
MWRRDVRPPSDSRIPNEKARDEFLRAGFTTDVSNLFRRVNKTSKMQGKGFDKAKLIFAIV